MGSRTCTWSSKMKIGAQSYFTQILMLRSNCIPLVTLINQITDSSTPEMSHTVTWPTQVPTNLTLHQCILEQPPPVLQQWAHPVPACVHLGQAILQIPALLTTGLGELGAAQVDGEDDGFAMVHGFLELLKRGRRTNKEDNNKNIKKYSKTFGNASPKK